MNSFKLQKKEDRISDLPDHIIHHILSFLPSTKQAIQTGILSKRWRNQWTRVPVLIFESPQFGMYSKQSDKQFLRLIDNALSLYDCSKIKKLQLCYNFREDPDFVSKLRFAMRKHVEELILNHRYGYVYHCYLLPEFLLDNSSLVELQIFNCCFRFDSIINWASLKSLKIVYWSSPYFRLPSFRKLVSGCPLLESFEFRNSDGIEMNRDDDIIESKSLKILVLRDTVIGHHLKISCPDLAELVISPTCSYGLPNKMIEISCPKLEWVSLCNSSVQIYKLVNCPALVYAHLDFEIHSSGENVAKHNLEQIQHVKKLTINSWFIKILSALEMEGVSYQMLKNKKLTLHIANFEDFLEITSALRSSPALERLDIKLPVYVGQMTADLSNLYEPRWNLNDCGENYWNSNETDVNCLMLHLKHVKIFGLNKRDSKSKLVINFVEFLLKNAGELETLVVVISNGQGTDFASKVSQKVLSFPRCSQHALVEIIVF